MAISGKETILIGLPNESVNSDSLFTAFNKAANNFTTLFDTASPYNTFSGNGISVTANATSGSLDFTNTGVVSLTPADSSIQIAETSPGNLVIQAVGGGNGGGSGTVTSVGSYSDTLNYGTIAGGNTIISAGTLTFDLKTTGITAGTYTYPTVAVDQYGRVTSISNAASVGTVTSVGITPGTGIQVTNSPITTSGDITIVNTGVTRLNAGTGISVSGSNGNVTISATSGTLGTVTSVNVISTSLDVSGGPVTSAGVITVNLPTNTTITGNVVGGNLVTAGKIVSSSSTSGIGYSTGAGSTVTQGTSRTTGVTINAVSGAITLFSAAGTSSYTTFTVTNSVVAATDVIIVNQKSGTDKYEAFVTAVAAGSFSITFSDVNGTTTEQPVFNFAVIKAVAA
jgi:hypothetical protein